MLKSFRKAIGQVFAIRTKTRGTPWLDHLLGVTNLILNSSDLLPFPYVKSGACLVINILQTIKDARKNEDDFRELLTSIVGIVRLVRDQILQNQISTTFDVQCIAFNDRLLDILGELHGNSRSTAKWKKYVRSAAIKDDIAGYRRAIDEARENFLLSTAIQTQRGIEQILDDINSLPR
ncbi:hypothetical protein C8J56DRAFT_483344 [Mycena floridula]|nr:hypothetical protein C8J56DRAFT_483344 [Mycena floridula]